MQETSIITQCPGCSTRFRVTPGQLKVADGKVRCGNCLNVFSAQQFALDQGKDDTHPSEAKSSEPKTSAPSSTTPLSEFTEKTPEQTFTAPTEESKSSRSTLFTESRAELGNTEYEKPELIKTVPDKNNHNEHPLHIQAEAVVLNTRTSETWFSWRWFLACSLALIMLLAQYLWFNRSEMHSHPLFSSLFSEICPLIDCKLPVESDVNQIQNKYLRIYDHPEIENAVIIDIALLNTASFNQPYPQLVLTFSDLKGRPVAYRVLQPKDYLESDLARKNAMPINQAVQVSIEMLSPGPRGTNYSLELLASED